MTNRELAEGIAALAAELGMDPPHTDRMNHAALTELHARLEEQATAKNAPIASGAGATRVEETPAKSAPAAQAAPAPAPPKPPIDGAGDESKGGPPPKPAAPSPMRKFPFSVAPGHSISAGPRGVLRAGSEVRLSDFGKDKAVAKKMLDKHIAAGRVIVGL